MNDYVNKLIEISPPPLQQSASVTDGEWAQILESHRIDIPLDFREIVDRYGEGEFGNFLWLLLPGSRRPHMNMQRAIDDISSGLRMFRDMGDCNQPIFPEEGGLIPWGMTLNGDALLWRTLRQSGRWSVVVNPGRSLLFYDYPMRTSEFLYNLFSKQATIDALSECFSELPPPFNPAVFS